MSVVKNKRVKALSLGMLIWLVATTTLAKQPVGIWLADSIVERYQPTIDVLTHHGWDHSNSIVLHGLEKIYAHQPKTSYLTYIERYALDHINEDGTINGLLTTLDGMHPGIVCLFLYQQTGKEKYRLAAKTMRDHFIGTGNKPSVFAKTPDGVYWHKNNEKYQDVASVDGLYMKDPFLVRYGLAFDEPDLVDDSTAQVLAVAARSFNIRTNLAFHAWSFKKDRSWADPITGQATQHWSRASGWFAMALVDILEVLPKSHANYPKLLYLYQRLAQGIKHAQNPTNGLWYQVLDTYQDSKNYPELSGSGMLVYAIQKGIDLGLLDEAYSLVSERGWQGMQGYIATYQDGGPQIISVAPGMSSKDSYEEYLAVRPITVPRAETKQYSHGYIGVLMASSVMEF